MIFGPFFVVFYFSFHLCFDLPQVPNCYESDSFIFCFLDHFLIFLFIFALTFHKCQIGKKAFLLFLFCPFFKKAFLSIFIFALFLKKVFFCFLPLLLRKRFF